VSELASNVPLDWRVAAGHRLVALQDTDADVVDVWVLNIWKEFGHLPAIEAVDAWHAVGVKAEASAAAGTHPHLSREAWWILTYADTWNKFMKGTGDMELLKIEGSVRFGIDGQGDPATLAGAEFEAMNPSDKKYYRGLPDRPKWVPPLA